MEKRKGEGTEGTNGLLNQEDIFSKPFIFISASWNQREPVVNKWINLAFPLISITKEIRFGKKIDPPHPLISKKTNEPVFPYEIHSTKLVSLFVSLLMKRISVTEESNDPRWRIVDDHPRIFLSPLSLFFLPSFARYSSTMMTAKTDDERKKGRKKSNGWSRVKRNETKRETGRL